MIWKSECEKNCYKGKGSKIEQKLPTLLCKNCLYGEGRGQLLEKSIFCTTCEVNTLNFTQKIHVDTDTMQLCLKFEMYLAEKKMPITCKACHFWLSSMCKCNYQEFPKFLSPSVATGLVKVGIADLFHIPC